MKRCLIEERLEDIQTDVKMILDTLGVKGKSLTMNGSDEDGDAFMTIKEVSAFLRLDESLIVEMCHKGEIPHVKRARSFKVRRNELFEWMRKKDKSEEGSIDDYVNRYLGKRPLKG